MIASKEIGNGTSNEIARFRSPVYNETECFSFQFNFGVSIKSIATVFQIVHTKRYLYLATRPWRILDFEY